jgi:hypothetical protein
MVHDSNIPRTLTISLALPGSTTASFTVPGNKALITTYLFIVIFNNIKALPL